MTTYKEIRGTNIEVLASDPSNPVLGQVWYNSTDNVVKGLSSNPGSWATQNDLVNPRSANAGAGTQSGAIIFAGSPPGTRTELWNGTNWTEVNDLTFGRNTGSGCGASSTAALAFAGVPTSVWVKTESWNGTNWSQVNDLNQGKERTAGSGIQTSALNYGGEAPGSTGLTESWNGTNWTEVADLNTARHALQGAGNSNTSALAFGGRPSTAVTELFNGSSWTEVNDLGAGRYDMGSAGTATLALGYGGKTSPSGTPPDAYVGLTESWNGTNWSETGDMNIARNLPRGAGTQAAAIAGGGAGPAPTGDQSAESFNSGPITVTFTDS